MQSEETLFHKYTFSDVRRNAPAVLAKAVDAFDDRTLMTGTVEALVDRVVGEHSVEIPVLQMDKITTSEREVEVDARGRDQDRRYRGGGPIKVQATEYRFFVPYEGDKEFFYCRPSTCSMSPPRAVIEKGEVIISVLRTEQSQDASAIRGQFDRAVAQINTHLDQLRIDAGGFPEQLRKDAQALIEKRRGKRTRDAKIGTDLGFPTRPAR